MVVKKCDFIFFLFIYFCGGVYQYVKTWQAPKAKENSLFLCKVLLEGSFVSYVVYPLKLSLLAQLGLRQNVSGYFRRSW